MSNQNQTPSAPIESTPSGAAPRTQKLPGTKTDKRQENILLLLLVVIIAGGIFVLYRSGVIGGNAAEKPIETYIQAICSRDFDSFVSVMPEKIAADHAKDRDELGLDGAAYLSELYADYFSEFGENMSASLDFTGRSRPDAVYVQNFKQSYAELYGEEIDFSSVFELDADVTFSGEKSSSVIQLEFFVIKSHGTWYVVGADYKTESAEE